MCLSEEQESRLTYLGIYSTSHKHPLCPHHIHRACTYPLAHRHTNTPIYTVIFILLHWYMFLSKTVCEVGYAQNAQEARETRWACHINLPFSIPPAHTPQLLSAPPAPAMWVVGVEGSFLFPSTHSLSHPDPCPMGSQSGDTA